MKSEINYMIATKAVENYGDGWTNDKNMFEAIVMRNLLEGNNFNLQLLEELAHTIARADNSNGDNYHC